MIITACGSARFKPLIHTICHTMQEHGMTVLKPPLHDMGTLFSGVSSEGVLLGWKGATLAHFERIRKSDIVLIVNPEGYSGTSTTLELGYAAARGKLVIALRHDPEPARDGLFDFVLESEDPLEIVTRIATMERIPQEVAS